MSKILPRNFNKVGNIFSSPPKFYQQLPLNLCGIMNEYIKINKNTIYYRYFYQKNLNHIDDLLNNNCKMKRFEDLRAKLKLDNNKTFYWILNFHKISGARKEMFSERGNNISNIIINKHHLIKKHQIYCLEKLSSKELYSM